MITNINDIMPTFFSQIPNILRIEFLLSNFFFQSGRFNNPAHSMTPEGILTFVEISID